MKFEIVQDNYDNIPIILVDCSGSTDIKCGNFDTKIKSVKGNVLNQELYLVKKYFESKNIDKIYLMFWNDKAIIHSKLPILVSSIDTIKIPSCGGTNLSPALKAIPDSWIDNKENIDLFIYTDGEICDDNTKLSNEINKLFKKKIRIYINTVEPNKNNYLETDCGAGNKIFEIIRSEKLTFRVKKFSSYNEYHNAEPFVSFSNPDVGPGLVSFRDNIFRIDKTHEFIEWIEDIITKTILDDELLKLALDLSMTLHHLTKNKSLPVQNKIINLFSELFVEKGQIYKKVRNLFLQEIDNHSQGKSSTFQTYKKNREKVFEKAQLSLFDNTKDSLETIPSDIWVSLPVDVLDNDVSNDNITFIKHEKYVITSFETNVSHHINLSDKTYKNAGVKINNYTIPMIPSKIILDKDIKDQCLRQWIRANYSKKCKLNASSDLIQYYFLIDAMKIILSDVSDTIKIAYEKLCMVMLDRKRFGTEITEYDYLLNNPPAPVTNSPVTNSSDDKINWILQNALLHSQIEQMNPMTLWFCFISALNDEMLVKAQFPYCKDDLVKDGLFNDKLDNEIPSHNKIFKFIKSKFIPIKEFELNVKKFNYDYQCYITLDDTSETGGYLIPKHNIGTKIICHPKFVLSELAYNDFCSQSDMTKCPICCKQLNLCDFVKVENEKELNLKYNKNQQLPNINEPIYDTNLYDCVKIPKNMYCEEEKTDFDLKKMSDCNFEVNSFQIDSPILKEAIGSRIIEIITQEEFNKTVEKRYPFLSKLNWDGVCLAGGFCRSILLRQRLKDFDFFFYGKDNLETFTNFMHNLLIQVKQSDEKIKFLIMYKHQFNVFEVVCVYDPNNFFVPNYKLDNFKQYDFKSLHQFDKYTIIDPETNKVYRKKKYSSRLIEVLDLAVNQNEIKAKSLKSRYEDSIKDSIKDVTIENRDLSNYFEDGDINGIRMKYRFQFILLNNDTISNLFSKFDMYPCRVAWDGNTTWFTNKSEFAYKYMCNIVNVNNYSSLMSHRLSKYFTYGFNIVMPELNIDKINQDFFDNKILFKIEDLVFNIIDIDCNQLLVEHNSHIADKIDSIERIEQKNMIKGKVLYKSSLFCSLVSLLRYIKINDISYKFTSDIILLDKSNKIDFMEKTEEIKFIDSIDTRIEQYDWYKQYKKANSDEEISKKYKSRLEILKNNNEISDKNYNIIYKSITKKNYLKVEKDLLIIENENNK